MANTYLIEIGINDTLPDVVRKCNSNFRSLSANQTQHTKQGIRREANRADAMLDGAVGEINNAVDEGLKKIEKQMAELKKELAPPLGTWLHCDYDPNEQWPGTTWVQYDEGYFIMSAGTTKMAGGNYGSKTKTVPLPSHSHSMSGKYVLAKESTPIIYAPVNQASGSGERFSAMSIDGISLISNTGLTGAQNATIDTTPPSIALPLWHRTK